MSEQPSSPAYSGQSVEEQQAAQDAVRQAEEAARAANPGESHPDAAPPVPETPAADADEGETA
jgi:hypothetical protein